MAKASRMANLDSSELRCILFCRERPHGKGYQVYVVYKLLPWCLKNITGCSWRMDYTGKRAPVGQSRSSYVILEAETTGNLNRSRGPGHLENDVIVAEEQPVHGRLKAHGTRECDTAALKEYGGRERAENLRREPGKGDDCLELESSMAESRLRAPDLGAQLGVSSCLGKCQKSSPDAGRQPFSGKSFYLDLPAGKNLQFLTGAIQQLGGVIEGFLSKEVSYIVSSRREAKAESSGTSHRGCPSPSEVTVETLSVANPKGSRASPAQKAVDSVPLSRGKELLQKAIRNQGSGGGGGGGRGSSLLSNARSWGVRILHVDEMMMHVQQLSLDAPCVKKQGPKKPEGTCPAESRTRKVARLKAPFLKVEDESREARDQEPSRRSAACTVPRRKKGYCECCQEAFEELRGHLQSPQHQGFALEARPYAEVDRIIAQLSHSFADIPFQASLPGQPGSLASDCDPLCPETPPPSQPSYLRAASPRRRKEDDHQAPGASEQDGTVGGMKAPAEPVEAGKIPGPIASHQEPGGSADVSVDPRETPVSRSPAYQCLLTSSGFAELSSGPDLALVGHKRKVQFPSGNAEKRPGVSWPQASFFVPRAPSPCGTRTTSGKHLPSLRLPGHEPRPLASLQPVCHQQTCLSLPVPFPGQPTDRPAEFWATQAPWPGGGWPPGSKDSECAGSGPVSQQAEQLPSGPAASGQLPAHLHSAAGTQTPGGPAESQATSLPPPLPASRGASRSRWSWTPQPLPASQSQPQPSANRELLL
ncbi:protein DBF4 homolog B isoform X3 [Delphinapterus leucas]|uniref:Protein DBF4 homolog B isoform X3 n=1 Tax=Delphinapterus leucas TaxID=9749 RepID=A0A2Y9MF52_DELLE|nr:protein DBF4 homolog B isoform X3 [Delphinapterus leucas]